MDDSSSPMRDERPRTPHTPRTPRTPRTPAGRPTQQPLSSSTPYDADEARDAALQRELAGVRQVNEAIEGILGTLEQSRGNMKTVSHTVANASALLNTWTRLLSQTEHSQRLILDPAWRGASQDLLEAEAEAEAVQRQQQEAERRAAAEAQRRRDDAHRKADHDDHDDRQRLAGTSSSFSSTATATSAGRAGRATSSLRSRGRITYSASGIFRRGSTSGNTAAGSRSGRVGASSGPDNNSNSTTTAAGSSSAYGYRGSSSGIGRGLTRGSRAGGRGVR